MAEDNKENFRKIESRISYSSVDAFRFATKDKNEVHNSKKFRPPLALGFQIESLIANYVSSNFNLQDSSLSAIETCFKNRPIFADQGFTLELLLEEDQVNAKIIINEKPVVLSKLTYGFEDAVDSKVSKLGKAIKIRKRAVGLFYEGLSLFQETSFPKMLLPSISTVVLENSVKKAKNKKDYAIYKTHSINFFPASNDFTSNSKAYLTVENHIHKLGLEVFSVSAADKRKNKLYEAKLKMAFVPEEQFYDLIKPSVRIR